MKTLADLLQRESARLADRIVKERPNGFFTWDGAKIVEIDARTENIQRLIEVDREFVKLMRRKMACTTSPFKKDRYYKRMRNAEVRIAALLLSK